MEVVASEVMLSYRYKGHFIDGSADESAIAKQSKIWYAVQGIQLSRKV